MSDELGDFFEALPDELKLLTFQWLRRMSHGHDFTAALQVCRRWHNDAAPCRWRFIAIDNENLLPFVRSMTFVRWETSRLVRNISIHVHPIHRIDRQFSRPLIELGFETDNMTWAPGDDLSELQLPRYLTLPLIALHGWDLEQMSLGSVCLVSGLYTLSNVIQLKLTMLKTFSMRESPVPVIPYIPTDELEDADMEADEYKTLPRNLIAELVHALPLGCTQIELICSEYTLSPDLEIGPNILCNALHRMLPVLTHLHLNCRYMSPLLFQELMTMPPQPEEMDDVVHAPSLPNLVSLVVNIYDLELTENGYEAYADLGEEFQLPQDQARRGWDMEYINRVRVQNIVADGLKRSLTSGRFPSTKRLQLISFDWMDDSGIVKTIDLLKDTLEIVSEVSFCLDGRDTVRFRVLACRSANSGELVVMDMNQFIANFVGSWISSTNGIRVPVERRNAPEIAGQGLQLIEPRNQGLDQDRFVQRIENEVGADASQEVDERLETLAEDLAQPYTVKGYIEWHDVWDAE